MGRGRRCGEPGGGAANRPGHGRAGLGDGGIAEKWALGEGAAQKGGLEVRGEMISPSAAAGTDLS